MATDCRSLYDLCNNLMGLPDERRVALDLLDVKEGLEEFHDKIRWVPTEHMLADALTKKLPPDFLVSFLRTNKYSFKYDDHVSNMKRKIKQQKARARKEKAKQLLSTNANPGS